MEFMVGGAPRRIEMKPLLSLPLEPGATRPRSNTHRRLAAIGVKRPRAIPCFYRLGANLLTTAPEVDVVGEDSSGEVEFVLVAEPDAMYVGVGSDHTDRKVEASALPYRSRCAPSRSAGSLAIHGCTEHWDRLVLRSHVTRKGKRRLYQEAR